MLNKPKHCACCLYGMDYLHSHIICPNHMLISCALKSGHVDGPHVLYISRKVCTHDVSRRRKVCTHIEEADVEILWRTAGGQACWQICLDGWWHISQFHPHFQVRWGTCLVAYMPGGPPVVACADMPRWLVGMCRYATTQLMPGGTGIMMIATFYMRGDDDEEE